LATGLLVAPVLPLAAFGRVPVPSPTAVIDDSTATPTSTPSPVCTRSGPTPVPRAAVAPNPAHSGETVVLDGSASTGEFHAVAWTQWKGPSVAIDAADATTASFIAPPVTRPTVFGFELVLFGCGDPSVFVASIEMTVLPPRGVASIAVLDTQVVPGGQAPVEVRLYTDLSVTRVAHDLTFESPLAIVATPDGHPDCGVPSDLDADAQFEFLPAGCTANTCSGVHVELAASEPIPDRALLYRCSVAAEVQHGSSCDLSLSCAAAVASDAGDQPLPVQCAGGVVRSRYPTPVITLAFTVDPPQPRVGDTVHVYIDKTIRGPSVRIRTFELYGTEPFFLGDVQARWQDVQGRVSYELRAVRAGTAELFAAATWEDRVGCPGRVAYQEGYATARFRVTISGAACAGDCDADGRVGIAELVTGVRMALGDAPATSCAALDDDGSGRIEIGELIVAVNRSLLGCQS